MGNSDVVQNEPIQDKNNTKSMKSKIAINIASPSPDSEYMLTPITPLPTPNTDYLSPTSPHSAYYITPPTASTIISVDTDFDEKFAEIAQETKVPNQNKGDLPKTQNIKK